MKHDLVFEAELHTPSEWEVYDAIEVKDPDGWRMGDAPSWDTPISYDEWQDRVFESTIIALPPGVAKQ